MKDETANVVTAWNIANFNYSNPFAKSAAQFSIPPCKIVEGGEIVEKLSSVLWDPGSARSPARVDGRECEKGERWEETEEGHREK